MRNIRTKIIKICMVVFCIVSNFTGVSIAAETRAVTPDAAFTFDANTGTITKYTASYGAVVHIPENINGVPVKKIGDSAFNIRGLVLTEVTFPDSLEEIGVSSFLNNKLTSLTLPPNLISIGDYAFAYNSLSTLTLPPNLISIGEQAFLNNQTAVIGIETLNINDKLEHIGSKCFEYQDITDLNLPNSVKTIGKSAFDFNKIKTLELSTGMDTIEEQVFGNNQLEEVIIPNTITTLGIFAFANNKIKAITIPDSVTFINQGAFYNNKLTEVSIPASVETIGYWAFAKNSISKINFNEGLLKIIQNAFEDNKLTDMQFPSSIQTIEPNVMIGQKSIGYYKKVDSHWELDLDDLSSTMFRSDVETVTNVMFDSARADYNSTTHVVTFATEPTGKVLTYDYLLAHPTDSSINGGYGDVTLSLQQKPDELTVSFDGDGGTPSASTIKVEKGGTYKALPTATKKGYTFGGWYTELHGVGTKVENTSTTISATDHTLYAKWDVVDWTVSFQSDGANETIPNQTIASGGLVVQPTATKKGYTFDKWYKEAGLINIFDFSQDTILEDTTLYAKWSLDTYNLIYQGVDGITHGNPQNYTVTTPTIILLEPSKTGYMFVGWYDGLGDTANKITEITIGSTGPKTLYAKWSADTHTITYNNLQGTSPNNPNSYKTDTPTFTLNEPTSRAGYTFDGWYDDATPTPNPVSEIKIGSTGPKTLYAKWAPITYQITYKESKEGTNSNPPTYTIESDEISLANMPNTNGYNFIGWFDGNQESANQVISIPKGSTKDINLYARYEPKQVEVPLQDGTETIQTKTVYFDQTYGELPTLEKTGYIFQGWYSEAEGKEIQITSETIVNNTSTHTLYANWKQIFYQNNKGSIRFENGQDIRYELRIDKTDITETMKKQENLISVYDIYFLLNDERVIIKDNKMIITLDLSEPEKYFDHYKVVYFDDNGNVIESYDPIVATDYSTLSFEIDHLSYYGIVAWKDEAPIVDDGGKEAGGSTSSETKTTGVATGVTTEDSTIYLIMMMASLCVFGITIKKRKHIKK